MPDVPGRHLVDRDPDVDVVAVGFARPHAGEERRVRARMVAAAVVARVGLVEVQAADHLEALAQRGQRLHGRAQFELCPGALRPPIVLAGAVGKIDEGHPQGRPGRRGRGPGRRRGGRPQRGRDQGFEGGQAEAHAHALEEGAAAEGGGGRAGGGVAW